MSDWHKDLSINALNNMEFLGNFGPTANLDHKTIKGYMYDNEGCGGKIYLDSGDLRELAAACNEVADWLDARASANKN